MRYPILALDKTLMFPRVMVWGACTRTHAGFLASNGRTGLFVTVIYRKMYLIVTSDKIWQYVIFLDLSGIFVS